MTFEAQHEEYLAACEKSLRETAVQYFQPGSKVSEAAEYSLLNGGKRVRGVLVLAVCGLLDGDARAAGVFAAALEMIHAFSLIHDDLPCMDDDNLRRGKPANHIVYGEATALLAGDMLAIQAFEVIASAKTLAESRAKAAVVLASAAGARGMIYGQELDLRYEKEPADEQALHTIHKHKTGALILAAVRLGICAAKREEETCEALLCYAKNIGLVFQIVDDLLDISSTAQVLGKPVGSDAQQGKTTFVSLNGQEAARREIEHLTREAVDGLRKNHGEKADFLCEYAQRLAQRVY